ncbi:helix-turn-helix domain-containing protein [Bifidobacterium pseudolongum]|uniref:helix-turn-helix domain-containing protein n=1 Tax=Bifidobacterium pseudolongum TaxID=1694 RepID=UPI0022E24185|nr:helix-turn-helix domain-containing protein [Bifidobacterium pseudolongum]
MSSLLVGHAVQKVDTGGDVLAKLVLLILADYANSEGKAWPSLDTLAKQTGRSEASVKRARAKLVDLGLIEVSDDQGYTLKYRGDKRPKVYDVLPMVDMPERPARPAKNPVEQVPPERNQDHSDDGSPMSPRTDNGGSPMHRTGAHGCTERGLMGEPQTVIVNNKLFTNRQSEPTRASAHRPTDNQEAPEPGREPADGIDLWSPNLETRALADELHADVDSEANRFRMRVHESGNTPHDPDAAFRKWLRQGDRRGILVKRQPPRPCDRRPDPTLTRHTHRWDCEHVLELMGPHEADYDHTSSGFGDTSEWALACQAAAAELNRQEASA